MFLIVTILLDVTQTRTMWLAAHTYEDFTFVRILTASTSWKAVLVLLESHQKQRWLRWDRKIHSPEETSGIYGIGTFSWLTTLFISGYKSLLTISDLFVLDRRMSAELLQTAFSDALQQEPMNQPSAKNKGYGLIGATNLIYTGIPLANAFYWKSLQAPASATNDSASLTLMSSDIEAFKMGLMFLHEFWATPIQVAVACWLLERQLGAAFAASIILILVCIFCSTILTRFVGPRQVAWMQRIQKRVGHTADVIGNMKNLKMSGLSEPVEEAIQELREDELNVGGIFRGFLVGSISISFMPVLLAPVFTFAVTYRDLDVTTIFTFISYILLVCEPLSILLQVAPRLISGLACLQRIQNFLEKDSRYDFHHERRVAVAEQWPTPSRDRPKARAIQIINGNFGWSKDKPDTFTLKNINSSIPDGLTIVVGPVASGKSTLCSVLLGEIPNAQGEVIMGKNFRRVGYCAQVPFLLNTTIRQSIVGFSAMDEKRYTEVVEATMLSQDISSFPHGDNTLVGSNGVALSGGQKHRISMARALYLQCDLVIFDDVFSGLDASTEECIFDRVFGLHGVLKRRGTAAVLCTHAVRHLPSADHIIALGNAGSIVEEGVFDELVKDEKYIHGLGVQAYLDKPIKEDTGPPDNTIRKFERPQPDTVTKPIESTRTMGDRKLFGHYFRSIGTFWLLNFVLIGVMYGFLVNFSTVWLKYWSEDVSSPDPEQSTPFYLGLYAMFQCLSLITLVIEAIIGLMVIIRIAGSDLHKAALRTMIAAPLSLFTKTDPGIVTNLFSQDMTLIDGELPQALTNTSLQVWSAVGLAAVVATSSPYILISYPFIAAFIYVVQRFYLRTSRQLRLLDLEAKSPLYTNFMDCLKGVTTYRAFGWTEDAISLNNDLLDTSQRPAYLLSMVQRWLAFVLGMVVAVMALLVVTLSTQLRPAAGFTGASMVSFMSFGKTLAYLVQMYTLLETSIGAVSRLKSFSDNTAAEDLPGETVVPPASWPEKGRIEIRDVSATYGDSGILASQESESIMSRGVDDIALGDLTRKPEHAIDLAVRNLVLAIKPGEKVAICGRIGSGKSSIILLLLRLLDPLPTCANNIMIDDIPLHTINRSALRSRIIAVPQDAVFFPNGTSFRKNLDPSATATDEQCKAVLQAVNLETVVCDLDAGMTSDSLSQGQKQLFSLARAVLRRRIRGCVGGGVLILDEVSSNVDMETERLMQKIIRHEFEGYTVVMVSHRLNVVVDLFDRVLVMDAGRVAEEGGRKGIQREKVLYPRLGHAGTDIELQRPTLQESEDSPIFTLDDPGIQIGKAEDGKLEYQNELHQVIEKYYDVAVYLSPTRLVPRRLVVQAAQYVLDHAARSNISNGDWLRTKMSGNVPITLRIAEWALGPLERKPKGGRFWSRVNAGARMLLVAIPLQILLCFPIGSDDEDGGVADTYTDFCGYYWNWPKFAINDLDMQPSREYDEHQEVLNPAYDSRKRSLGPSKLVVEASPEWTICSRSPSDAVPYPPAIRYVFISYNRRRFREVFGVDSWKSKIHSMASRIARELNVHAYWFDEVCLPGPNGKEKDYELYTMCDLVRGSAHVAVLLPTDSPQEKADWGERLWCLPEGMLAPNDGVWCYCEDDNGDLVREEVHKIEMTSTFWHQFDQGQLGGSAIRVLAEHYSGALTLSRLELLPAIINALSVTGWTNINGSHSDLPYAVMGFLHYRWSGRHEDYTQFQSLVRMCLGNDNDQIIERMVCLLPPATADEGGARKVSAVDNSEIWRTLSQPDQFGTHLHDIQPLCDVVGVAHEDKTVIIDNCRAIHIRWKGFPRPVVESDASFGRSLASIFIVAGAWWLIEGINLTLNWLPFWVDMLPSSIDTTSNGTSTNTATATAPENSSTGLKYSYLAWLVGGFLIVALMLSATAPISIRRLYGDKILKSKPSLVGFEGTMPIKLLEKLVFGNHAGRLTYAPSSTTFCRGNRHPTERRGTAKWVDDPTDASDFPEVPPGHHLFTLVDMGDMSVSIVSAERPPTVALLCGREGGMLRAVLCSWRFENDCLFKETVIRMSSSVYDSAIPKDWLKVCLSTQDQARRAGRGADF
ncbi:hypothetical protein N0V82_008028 [Gnomoniopsis sp. IMI 355080]|nr:hypothetical protein N0V82_008028 [Gnomoniopsis sp. IMI 355080]